MRIHLLIPFLLLAPTARAAPARAPAIRLLWPAGAPGALGTDDTDKPSLTVFLPPAGKAVGAGVVICPGGAYTKLSMDHEGAKVADWLNNQGIAAFVLRYRLGPRYHHPIELHDVQRAIRAVRSDANAYGVAPDRIGVLGFSAGGHLASTAATMFDDGDAKAGDPIDRVSCRPDFAVLCYPVILMVGPGTHEGSRKNLLGDTPSAGLMEQLSSERHVTARTPPTFLFHTDQDKGVPAENSVAFYLALRQAHVPAELHIYERGGHGLGLATLDPILSTWTARLSDWFRARGIIPK